MKPVNILSLFDGMACGMLAMMKAGLQVNDYFAFEIDKYAIQTATHNFPNIKELGNVFGVDFTWYDGFIDYLIGGSPCTYWSIAQSPDKRETTASGVGWELFSQYVRALHEAKPKFFIYENNKSMSKEIIRAFLKTTYSSPYKSMEIIVENMDEYTAMLNRAKNELKAFADKYSTLSELDTVIEAINSVIGETK